MLGTKQFANFPFLYSSFQLHNRSFLKEESIYGSQCKNKITTMQVKCKQQIKYNVSTEGPVWS